MSFNFTAAVTIYSDFGAQKKKSLGEGNGKPLQYSFLENPMNSMKRQKGEVNHHYSCGEGVKSSLSSTVCRLSSDWGFEVIWWHSRTLVLSLHLGGVP